MDKDKPNPEPQGDRPREAAEWLLELRDGDLTTERLAEWMEWRSRDSRNGEAFERATELSARIGATPPEAMASLIEEFGTPAQSTPSQSRSGRSRWWRFGAAAGVAGIASALIWALPLGSRVGQDQALAYDTPVATNRDIPLPDGSEVALGAASSLKARFDQDARHIELRDGEAFFKVKHEEKRAFYVHAGKLTVRAVGTAFDVRKTGERITVVVTEGRVRVAEAAAPETADDANTNTVEVAAGEQVAYSPGSTGLQVAKVDAVNAAAWREERLEFVNEPLESVIANINRYSKRPVRIADPAIGKLTFTGTVSLQSLDRWLVALQNIFPVQVDTSKSAIVIRPTTSAS